MRTYKAIGVAGTVAALLLSGTVAFAQGRPASAGSGSVTQGGAQGTAQETGSQYRPASAGSSTTGAPGNPSGTNRPAMMGSTTPRGPGGMMGSTQSPAMQGQARGAQMRQAAQERIAAIQDKVKQQLAQRLAAQFDQINKTWTEHFMQMLDRYDTILQKVQDRATAAATAGKDTTSTNVAIAAAKASIATARTAVTAQAAKTYTLDLSTATTTVTAATSTSQGQMQLMQGLRTSFQNLHETLFKDLFALRGYMTATRSAVQSALQTLGQIPGVDQVSATSTETTSTNQ